MNKGILGWPAGRRFPGNLGWPRAQWGDAVSRFPPVEGYVRWYDGADFASLTLDGSDNIQQWNDKSGNNDHLTQGTSGIRPAFSSAHRLNRFTVPYFAGSKRLEANYNLGVTATTRFTVYVPDAGNSTGIVWGPPTASMCLVVGDGGSPVLGWGHINSARTFIDSPAYQANMRVGHCIRYDPGDGFVDMWVNKTYQRKSYSTAVGSATPFQVGWAGTSIGGGPFTFIGSIAEILFYDSKLSDTQVVATLNYLIGKWGLS